MFFVLVLLYGSWEAIHSSKTLPRGPPTFSTPGEAIPRLFEKSIFLVQNGPGPMGPMGMGPWAQWAWPHGPGSNGHGPLGPDRARTRAQWAWGLGPNGHGPLGPMGMGRWAQWAWAHGPGPTPWGAAAVTAAAAAAEFPNPTPAPSHHAQGFNKPFWNPSLRPYCLRLLGTSDSQDQSVARCSHRSHL